MTCPFCNKPQSAGPDFSCCEAAHAKYKGIYSQNPSEVVRLDEEKESVE